MTSTLTTTYRFLLLATLAIWYLIYQNQMGCIEDTLPLVSNTDSCDAPWAKDGIYLLLLNFGIFLLGFLLLTAARWFGKWCSINQPDGIWSSVWRWFARIHLAIAIAVNAVIAILLACNYVYWVKTRQFFTWPLLEDFISTFNDRALVIVAESTTLIVLTVLGMIALPVLLYLLSRQSKLMRWVFGCLAVLVIIGAFIRIDILNKHRYVFDSSHRELFRGFISYFLYAPIIPLPLVDELINIKPLEVTSVSDTKKPNVLLVILESFRVDNLHGDQPLAPNIKKFAEGSIYFDQVYTAYTHSSHALFSLHCGIPPSRDSKMSIWAEGGKRTECFPALMKAMGYRSHFFQSASSGFENRNGLVEYMGYDQIIGGEDLEALGFPQIGYFNHDDKALIPPLLEWIDSEQEKPWIATLFNSISHHPYDTPDKECLDTSLETIRTCYDETIRYVDDYFNTLMASLEESTDMSNTVVVVIGDHGEGFGDHRSSWFHDNSPYLEAVKVPVMIKMPNKVSSENDASLHSLLDIAPTILALTGADSQGGLGINMLGDAEHQYVVTQCFYIYDCFSVVSASKEQLVIPSLRRLFEKYDLQSDPETQNPIEVDAKVDHAMLEYLAVMLESIRVYFDESDSAESSND